MRGVASVGGVRRLWNANILHDGRLAALVTRPASAVLDVGCGDGFLSALLASRGHRVTGLDTDAPVLERARERWPDVEVSWVQGDLRTAPLAYGSFDSVLSNATLHHLPDAAAALRRMADLVRPGGVLGVVGFARNAWYDWPLSLAGQAVLIVLNRVNRRWEHTAPQHWPPAYTYGELRRIARHTLPGVRYRRLLLGRYELVWRKPAAGDA